MAGGYGSFAGGGPGTLVLSTNSATLVITSETTTNGQVGEPYSYQTTASNNPTMFGATGLPDGLTANTNTGDISGTPTVRGNFTAQIMAANASAVATAALNIMIAPPAGLFINSVHSATGQVGQAFSYQITVDRGPAVLDAFGLPDGLTVNTNTGVISGSPKTAGSFAAMLRAENANGIFSSFLDLTILPAVPVSQPVIRQRPKGDGKITLEWDKVNGQTCHVESTTNLVNPNWQSVGDPITATNVITSVSYVIKGEKASGSIAS